MNWEAPDIGSRLSKRLYKRKGFYRQKPGAGRLAKERIASGQDGFLSGEENGRDFNLQMNLTVV